MNDGNVIVLDEKEVEKIMNEGITDDPYHPILWRDDNGEVILATSGDAVRFKKCEDAERVFKIVKELFNPIKDRKVDSCAAACGQTL